MAFVSRSRANSDLNNKKHRDWMYQIFPSYIMPHDSTTMRTLSRYLGTYMLALEYSSVQVMFYQVAEVEFDSSSSEEEHLSPTLPPKKRRRQRVTRSQVIFCLEHQDQQIDSSRQYFLFPQEAIVECINSNPPFEVLISYHAPSVCSIPNIEFKQPRRRLTDPGIPYINNQVIHVRLSCVSNELFTTLKQTVSEFEIIYNKMMELSTLHGQHLSTMHTNNLVIKEQQINDWTSEEDEEMKIEEDDDEFILLSSPNISTSTKSTNSSRPSASSTKQCLYCGSKSTPMWRRGPQGAGTLCNACGVKWKHGKILCDQIPTKVEKKKRKYTSKKPPKKKPIEDDLNKLSVQETLSSVEEAAALLTLLKQS